MLVIFDLGVNLHKMIFISGKRFGAAEAASRLLTMMNGSESDLDDSEDDPDFIENEPAEDSPSEDAASEVEEQFEDIETSGTTDPVPTEGLESSNRGTRKRKRNPGRWKRNVRKIATVSGNKYVDSRGRNRPSKVPKPFNCDRCRYGCSRFTEDARTRLCDGYWKLANYERQKDFLLKNMKISTIKRRRAGGERATVQRGKSFGYYLPLNGIQTRVCKKFFMNTLDIGHGRIDTAVENRDETGNFEAIDGRGHHVPGNKIPIYDVNRVKTHIESLPTMESHYTRKDTKRLYLNQNLSIRKMHELYIEAFDDEAHQPVKESFYRKIFCEEYNLSFFSPKKDQCSKCVKYENLTGQAKEDFKAEYDAHIERHSESQAAKADDKIRASTDQNFVSATFDLESVLQIPHSKESSTYYSRKLNVYNLTVYEAAPPNKGFCYCWPEVEGKRGSNEIGSAVYSWLQSLPDTTTEVSLYSDTCSGQNRNQYMAAMFLHAVQNIPHLQTITHNFLESGHSHMECDSMHSAIESAKRNVDVYSMLEWRNVFRQARRRNEYKVIPMNHADFWDLKALVKSNMCNRRKDTEGNNVNWLLMKSMMYMKAEPGIIHYRYRYAEEYKALDVTLRGRGRPAAVEMKKAYTERFSISVNKKNDLIKLCQKTVIPEELHGWFRDLPAAEDVDDLVPCPAVEDSGNESDD